MRIERGQQIAGFDAIDLRDRLKKSSGAGPYGMGLGQLAATFDVSEADVFEVIDRLSNAGLIEPAVRQIKTAEQMAWRTTLEGNALAGVAAGKPFKRGTIDRALGGLLEAVSAVNADADLMYWVDEVVVFGSYLDPTVAELSDLDVYLQLTPRWGGMDDPAIEAWRERRVETSGRRFSTFIQELTWPEREVHLRLKGSTALAICSHHPRAIGAPFKVVYRRPGGSAVCRLLSSRSWTSRPPRSASAHQVNGPRGQWDQFVAHRKPPP